MFGIRPQVVLMVSAILSLAVLRHPIQAQQGLSRPPNIVIIFTDDQGYGDLGSYGHPTIQTPVIDRLAFEGQRWTSFYAAPVCSPSRAQLLTGRLAARTGIATGVFGPASIGGLQPSEVLIPEMLKTRGYVTAAIGKWHLGTQPEYLPTSQGFDSYYGIPYSNDMDMIPPDQVPGGRRRGYMNPDIKYFNVPLMRGTKIVERPADQHTLTKRYTDEAVAFIRSNQSRPFFLYLAHNMPHMPLFRSEEFAGRSVRGRYGDVIEEIDANVGRLVETLKELRLEQNTLVIFLSDNGPWTPFAEQGGSAGLLRGAKGSNWEGGVRVPAVFWWPGHIKPMTVTGIGSELDLLQTIAAVSGASLPNGRPLDGYDLSPTLLRGDPSPRRTVFYWGTTGPDGFFVQGGRIGREPHLMAVRHDGFKLILHPPPVAGGTPAPQALAPTEAPPSGVVELYDLNQDPSERFNLADARTDVVKQLRELAGQHEQSIVPGINQVNGSDSSTSQSASGRGAGTP